MFVSDVSLTSPSPHRHQRAPRYNGQLVKPPETFICMDYFNRYCLKAVFIVIYLKKNDEKIK